MESTHRMSDDKRICPKCGSENVRDTGNRMSAGVVDKGQRYPEPTEPIFECGDCGETIFPDL